VDVKQYEMSSSAQSDIERAHRIDLLRAALPACQPQEGSPANTFTASELEELRSVMRDMNLGPRDAETNALLSSARKMDIFNPKEWVGPQDDQKSSQHAFQTQDDKQGLIETKNNDVSCNHQSWYGAINISNGLASQQFRQLVRQGKFTKPTNGQCPGFMQCNLVVLPEGQHAFDFLLFCQRNKKACPLVEVCDVGSPYPHGVARGADLRTDIPK
jgi:hypothetical protein